MKFFPHSEKALEKAIDIKYILKAGVVAIDDAFREKREIHTYNPHLFKDINPDHIIPFADDQVALYDFKNYSATEISLSLFYAMGINYADFSRQDISEKTWEKLSNTVNRLKGRPIYFLAN